MRSKIIFLVLVATGWSILTLLTVAQEKRISPAQFREVVEDRLKTDYQSSLRKICPLDTDPTAARIFKEYGAIFVSRATILPGKCIFEAEAELQNFQVRAKSRKATVGGTEIELQQAAMEAFLKARRAAAAKNLAITPRGGALAAKRSFEDTVRLWNSRFAPGLAHWVARRRITAKEAAAARRADIREQVERVLEWEKEGLYFSKDLTKSILFSVAAPGASQHNFMLALDVEQFADREVRKILAANGWFQTVKSDLPHFTYLGVEESELPALGLQSTVVGSQKFWTPNYLERE